MVGKNRRDYVRIYICVSSDRTAAMCDADGSIIGFTDFGQAESEAIGTGFMVTSFAFYRSKIGFSKFSNQPAQVRIRAKAYGGRQINYIAKLDAEDRELATLNETKPSDLDKTPAQVRKMQETAKVWPE